jgi:hypothetical protein
MSEVPAPGDVLRLEERSLGQHARLGKLRHSSSTSRPIEQAEHDHALPRLGELGGLSSWAVAFRSEIFGPRVVRRVERLLSHSNDVAAGERDEELVRGASIQIEPGPNRHDESEERQAESVRNDSSHLN